MTGYGCSGPHRSLSEVAHHVGLVGAFWNEGFELGSQFGKGGRNLVDGGEMLGGHRLRWAVCEGDRMDGHELVFLWYVLGRGSLDGKWWGLRSDELHVNGYTHG